MQRWITAFKEALAERKGWRLAVHPQTIGFGAGTQIIIPMDETELQVFVFIPVNYPYSRMRFSPRGKEVFAHQMPSGFLCIQPAHATGELNLMKADLQGLNDWVERFLIEGQTDSHFEMLRHVSNPEICVLFDEFEPLSQEHGPYPDKGTCRMYPVSSHSKGLFLADGLGGKPADWAEHFKGGDQFRASWAWLPKAPLNEWSMVVDHWADLEAVLPSNLFPFLVEAENAPVRDAGKKLQKYHYLFLGYPIPRADGKMEKSWDVLLIKRSLLKPANLRPGEPFEVKGLPPKIERGESKNAAYERMFGRRGGLGERLRAQRILIMGTGALGSRLSSLLVKGGAKNLSLMDYDVVEPGNLCRGDFRLEQVNKEKTLALEENLRQLSPFVQINRLSPLILFEDGHTNRSEQESLLSEFDLIVDCTANFTLAVYLDQLTFRTPILNLSITSGARELVCATGKPMETELRDIFDRVLARPWADGEVWEGAGCTAPTFEAAQLDIDPLLGLALLEIDRRFENQNSLTSFLAHRQLEDGIAGIQITGDFISYKWRSYFQPELGVSVKIHRSALEQIEKMTKEHIPKEYGGILLGSCTHDRKEARIYEVYHPKKYQAGPAHFERPPEEMNHFLQKRYKESKGKIDYLGEWHSHPTGPLAPSSLDKQAMKEIASLKSVNTNLPILLIRTASGGCTTVKIYIHQGEKLHVCEPI